MANQRWIVKWGSCPDPVLRLFCFPFAGGSPYAFRNWATLFPEQVEICVVQLPGRGSRQREQPYRRLDELVRELATGLLPYLDVPFAFFGHSMGALVCFEVARFLRRYNRLIPTHLFASGFRAPQIERFTPLLHALPDADLARELELMKGTPALLLQDSEFLDLMLPRVRADLEVCETYTYYDESPLSCPITALGGAEDPDVPESCLLGWRAQTNASFKLCLMPGDHFYLQDDERQLVEVICGELKWLLNGRMMPIVQKR